MAIQAKAAPKRGAAAQQRRAIGPAFEKECAEIGALARQLERNDVIGRVQFAGRIAKVKERWRGEGIRKLASSQHLDESTLYEYARVFEQWGSIAEVRKWVDRAAKADWALSWSHFVELKERASIAQLNAILEKALAKKMTVRELRGSLSPAVAKEELTEEQKLKNGYRRTTVSLTTLVGQLARSSEALDSDVLTPLEKDPGQINDETAKALTNAQKANLELADQATKQAKRIEQLLAARKVQHP